MSQTEAEHDRSHGGDRTPGYDAAHWDARYGASTRLWSAEPNATVREVVAPLPSGRALDLGAGEGRHAVWLAHLGWTVTAIDFSRVGIERGRRAAGSDSGVDWHVADVREWQPDGAYDLVLVAYLHVMGDVLARATTWLASGGRFVVVGHALRNLTEGVGGPSDARLLYTEEALRSAASGLLIERLGEILRPTDAGTAIDICLVARRTVGTAAAG